MAKIIDGKLLAEKIKDGIVEEILKMNGKRPNLAIIIVGDRPDSKLYVGLKEREAKKVGIDTHLYCCPDNISEAEVFSMIKFLNEDDAIDAILVQLPLPDGFDTDGIILAIDPKKDVDRFHPDNLKQLFSTCDHAQVIPPVANVVLEMLASIECDLTGKTACILSNSDIFGRSIAKVLDCRQAITKVVRPEDKDWGNQSSQADILITAVGRPGIIKKEHIKKGAIIIDIGITEKNGKVFGDVDFEDVKDKADQITPVPGGVGPMTIAMALQNTLELYKQHHRE